MNSAFQDNISQQDALAFFRYTIILPLIEAKPGTIRNVATDIASKTYNDPINKKYITISESTVFTYYRKFKQQGFNGLKPKVKVNKGSFPSVPKPLVKEILALKEELPSRSSEKIITMLELAKKIKKSSLKARTVSRILYHYGYTRIFLAKDKRVYIRHEKAIINQMWQSDVMEGFYVPDTNGDKKLVYLIGFIDDHSRRILHCQFYFDATLTRLEDCLKKAITKFGTPVSLYVDNGKIYISDNFKLICAKLGIRLIYSTPYKPTGKGKIEKFWEYVQSSIMPEVKFNKVSNIFDLNDMFQGWLQEEYHNKVHSSLGLTPIESWNKSLATGAKLKFVSPVELDEAFLHSEERTVTKYGTISYEGNTYEVDGALVGRKILLRYNPFHLDYVHIYYNNAYFGTARVIDLKTEKHKSVGTLEEDPCVDSEISKQYLNNIKSSYQGYLTQQFKFEIDKNIAVDKSKPLVKEPEIPAGEHGFKPPKDITLSIDKSEFLGIVKASLSIDNLTFAEKGKLYDLWNTFKEFNKDILISILSDVKEKSPDYDRNFLYYLSQIKALYLSKQTAYKVKENKK